MSWARCANCGDGSDVMHAIWIKEMVFLCKPCYKAWSKDDRTALDVETLARALYAEMQSRRSWDEAPLGMHTSLRMSATAIAREYAALRASAPAPTVDAALYEDMLRWVANQSMGWGGDWACVQCHPDSDMLVTNFRCLIHRARAALRASAPGDETP